MNISLEKKRIVLKLSFLEKKLFLGCASCFTESLLKQLRSWAFILKEKQ